MTDDQEFLLKQVIANLRLEGFTLRPEQIELFTKIIEGDVTIEEAIAILKSE